MAALILNANTYQSDALSITPGCLEPLKIYTIQLTYVNFLGIKGTSMITVNTTQNIGVFIRSDPNSTEYVKYY
jgi:hypothetical protein